MKPNFSNFFILCIFTAFFISACATRLDQVSPANTDLSGTWLLDKNASQTVGIPSIRSFGNASGMGGAGGAGGMGGGEREGNAVPTFSGGISLTPAMKAVEMTIEQNHDSMGIAYPNEIYRDIDWGKKEFFRETVSAGWQEDLLIVKSTSDEMTLTETYQLNSSKNIISLTLLIKNQRGTNEFVRVFNLQK